MIISAQDLTDRTNIIRKLCEHWPELTREDFRNFLTEDCVYLNVPMPELKCIGPDQTYKTLSSLMEKWRAVEFALKHIQGDGNAFLVERSETFERRSGDGPVVTLQSMGVFEFRDGKVCQWRDYFDPREAQPLAG